LQLHDLNALEYEAALNPLRYRHSVVGSIVKQYIREHVFVGECEIEVASIIKKHMQKKRSTLADETSPEKSVSDISNVQSIGNFSNYVLALQDA
jgi:hypothetical protein